MKTIDWLVWLALFVLTSCSPFQPRHNPSAGNGGGGGGTGPSGSDFYVAVRIETLPTPAASAFQFDVTYDPAQMKPDAGLFSEPSAEALGASKQVECNKALAPDTVRCILYGLNKNILPNASMVRLKFNLIDTQATFVNFQVKNAVISDPTGSEIPIPSQGAVVSYKPQSQAAMKALNCSFEGDVEVRLLAFKGASASAGKILVGLPECKPL